MIAATGLAIHCFVNPLQCPASQPGALQSFKQPDTLTKQVLTKTLTLYFTNAKAHPLKHTLTHPNAHHHTHILTRPKHTHLQQITEPNVMGLRYFWRGQNRVNTSACVGIGIGIGVGIGIGLVAEHFYRHHSSQMLLTQYRHIAIKIKHIRGNWLLGLLFSAHA